jgi:adenylate cyclase
VESIEQVAAGAADEEANPSQPLMAGVRRAIRRLADATDIDDLTDRFLDGVQVDLNIAHSMLLLCDSAMTRLYTVASRGYPVSGVGSEIPMGAGIIGVTAQHGTAIRINHSAQEYGYGRAVRESVLADGGRRELETEIAFPGLTEPQSQLAVPVRSAGELLGVLYAESERDAAFTHEHEDTLGTLGEVYGLLVVALRDGVDAEEAADIGAAPAPGLDGSPLLVRRYPRDNSIFLGDDYLIKGVAGAILWKLLSDYLLHQRVDFSNRELRCDPAIRLPDIVDNLEARLILLTKRLDERSEFIRIEKTGRGRFRLRVGRRLSLVEVPV